MTIEKCDECKQDLTTDNPNYSNLWLRYQPDPRGLQVEFRVKIAGQQNPGALCKECVGRTLSVAAGSRSFTPGVGRIA